MLRLRKSTYQAGASAPPALQGEADAQRVARKPDRTMDAEIRKARLEDLNAVLALLADASLPREGVAEHFRHFLVAHGKGVVVGSVGQEHYGQSSLLRSLVVAPPHQGRGLGRALTERIVEEARGQSVKQLFLLTETAPGFFSRFGFKQIPREEAASAVKESVEFRTACCQSAVCMRLEL